MAEFHTFDLARIIASAEQIKSLRRREEGDRLEQAYFRDRGTREAAQESRAAEQFTTEQKIRAWKLTNAASAEVMENPAAIERWLPELTKAGVLEVSDPDAWRNVPPEQIQAKAREYFESSSRALAALSGPQDTGPLESVIGDDGQPVLATRRQAVGRQPYDRAGGGSDNPIVREFKVGDRIVTREFDRATRKWRDVETAPRYSGDETGGSFRSGDANVFSRLAGQAYGGFYDPLTGQFSGLDKETARKASRLASQAARMWRESGGQISHNEAFDTVMERERGDFAPSEPPPGQPAAPAAAIEMLRKNPDLKDRFLEKYGYVPEGI